MYGLKDGHVVVCYMMAIAGDSPLNIISKSPKDKAERDVLQESGVRRRSLCCNPVATIANSGIHHANLAVLESVFVVAPTFFRRIIFPR